MRSLRFAFVLIALAACGDDRRADESTDGKESTAAVRPSTVTVPAPQTAQPSARTDSVIVRARIVLAKAAPSFREWTADMFAPVQEATGAPSLRPAPLVGDFDEDGSPDVAFTGRDSAGAVIRAVMSHRGQPVLATVTREAELAIGVDLRRSRLALARDVFNGSRREMIDVVVWDDRGAQITLSARFIYEKGRFSIFVSGV
jgi:hypothetical protein